MKGVHPYLNFDGNTREAFDFYRSVFGGDFVGVYTFRESGGEAWGVPEADLDKIMHIALPIGGGVLLMATDVLQSQGQRLTPGNNYYVMLDVESADEADRLFNGLKEGGSVEMEIGEVDWAERYGICRDRWGIQWMINYSGNKGDLAA
ncbi:MAG TPA: VOC family protein [Rhodothermales bacterium]